MGEAREETTASEKRIRTYRVTDAAGNYRDIKQTIIIRGTVPSRTNNPNNIEPYPDKDISTSDKE